MKTKQNIAVIVPTIRDESYQKFYSAWQDLFYKHDVTLYTVFDGKYPRLERRAFMSSGDIVIGQRESVRDVMGGKYAHLIYNFNDGVRNLGFAAAVADGMDILISLDDDVRPCGDTIQDHIDALSRKYPVSWMNTVEFPYMRGFPYHVRDEAQAMLSHGVWKGVADFDASTQLVLGTPEVKPIKMPIPHGVLFPMCIMNVAIRVELLPWFYQAPMFGDINRFADIWAGVEAKKAIDAQGWAAVTGYATVHHERASDPLKNLVKEARGIGMHENYGDDEYFAKYEKMRNQWHDFIMPFIVKTGKLKIGFSPKG